MRVAALILAALLCAGCSSEKHEASAADEHAPDSYKVKFETSKGDFVVTVTRDWSPLGADRFYTLVKNGFYDGARFFRVLPGFVVQFGIAADPQVTAKWRNANLVDDPVKQSNRRATLTFATGGPNTRTTQVFINLADNAQLDPRGFSPFGAVSQGMEVVDQLYSGYGEGAPSGNGPEQSTAESDGNAYLMRDFPKLDYIKKASIEK
jgi:peptidyl-prolyl cis-trans isomerase A (cyclophilin A)